MRWVKVLPSERVISCVKVYGRLGRRRSVACLHCVQMKVVLAGLERDAVEVRRMGRWRDIVDVLRVVLLCSLVSILAIGGCWRNDLDLGVQMFNWVNCAGRGGGGGIKSDCGGSAIFFSMLKLKSDNF